MAIGSPWGQALNSGAFGSQAETPTPAAATPSTPAAPTGFLAGLGRAFARNDLAGGGLGGFLSAVSPNFYAGLQTQNQQALDALGLGKALQGFRQSGAVASPGQVMQPQGGGGGGRPDYAGMGLSGMVGNLTGGRL